MLKYVSLLGAIVGIILLYFVMNSSNINPVKIGDINDSHVNDIINITGFIDEVNFNKQGHIFLEIKDDTGSIKVVIWNSTLDLLENAEYFKSNLERGNKINIIGEIKIYNNELEIIPIKGEMKILDVKN